ncbi:ABC transporter permease [Candidatus Saccharibacteria bacterium]|nr:ABC transporter permease [Candidatus Saccharibacteria bacterium]
MTDEKDLKKNSKRGLKVMRKSHEFHPIRNEGRILKYGAKGFSRNIWLSVAATIVMAITLIISFVTITASVILSNTAETMREKIDITIYLKPNTSLEDLNKLKETIEKDANVKSVVISTSKEEYEKFLSENQDSEEIIDVMDEEMSELMISKMQATMRLKVYDVDNLDSIKEIVETDDGFVAAVDEEKAPTYDVNQVEIATITSWAKIARTGGLILAIVFLMISVLIIFSTIRMAIFSRREEIYMMKLVGADKRFIRGPFLIEAEISGMIAGIIAAMVSYVGFMFLAPKMAGYGIDVSAITDVLNSNQSVLVCAAFVLLGVLIGRISSRLAVQKYLHKA